MSETGQYDLRGRRARRAPAMWTFASLVAAALAARGTAPGERDG